MSGKKCQQKKCQESGQHACARCQAVLYCSRACQLADWKARHHSQCVAIVKADVVTMKKDNGPTKRRQKKLKGQREYGPEAVEKIMDKKYIDKAIANLPDSHVQYYRWAWRYLTGNVCKLDEEKLRTQLTMMRLTNPICATCHEKSAKIALNRCDQCFLYTYCSKECQETHWQAHHKKWCAKMKSEPFDPDNDYLPIFFSTEPEQIHGTDAHVNGAEPTSKNLAYQYASLLAVESFLLIFS